MEKLSAIVKLLGEENEKRFKETVTDMLIEYVKEDLNDMGVYLIDFNDLFDDIRADVKKEVKEKIYKHYIDMNEKKFHKLYKETFGEVESI